MIEFNVLVARGTMTEPNDANSMLDMFGRWCRVVVATVHLKEFGSMGGGQKKKKNRIYV
jgi:hypothetical protein